MLKPFAVLVGVALGLTAVGLAQAGPLGTYKRQSMGATPGKVTSENCPEEYKKDCKSRCAPGAGDCVAKCDQTAEQFCKDRESRRNTKKLELAAKAASLGAGAIAMIFDDKMATVDPNGNLLIDEYTLFWNRPSFWTQLGGGLLQGGTKLALFSAQFRKSSFGLATSLDYMWEGNDRLAEFDIGPTINFGTAHLVVGFEPALMIRSGNGFKPVYGGGLRSLNTYYNGRAFVQFNPLLGYVNDQWAYDLKLSAGYRMSPAFSIDVGYSHRDILNLNDLHVSESGLNGAFLRLGYRMN